MSMKGLVVRHWRIVNMMLSYNFQWEWILRIILAELAGGMIGFERHNRSKVAGVRTHCIVCAASALMTLVSIYGFLNVEGGSADISRVASSIIPGMGFLGAGIIFVRKDTIVGLTTAAGIWATLGIGMAFGAGMYLLGICATLLILGVQLLFHSTRYFGDLHMTLQMEIIAKKNLSVKNIVNCLNKLDYSINEIRVNACSDREDAILILLEISSAKDMNPEEVLRVLQKISGVFSVKAATPDISLNS